MPVKTKKIGEKWRVVEASSGKIVLNRKGNPVDGGGHQTEQSAKKQAAAINANK